MGERKGSGRRGGVYLKTSGAKERNLSLPGRRGRRGKKKEEEGRRKKNISEHASNGNVALPLPMFVT